MVLLKPESNPHQSQDTGNKPFFQQQAGEYKAPPCSPATEVRAEEGVAGAEKE